jgi:hypothetical protein
MMITTWKTSSAGILPAVPRDCHELVEGLALGAAGEDARRTAAGTAALLSR